MKNKKVNSRHRPQIYSDDFKWKVVQEVLSGKITQAEAKRKYNIKSNSAILYWTRQLSGWERIWTFYQKKVWCQAIRRTKEVKETKVKITDLTELFGYTKQSYYKKIKTREKHDIQESLVLDLIKKKRKLWKNLCWACRSKGVAETYTLHWRQSSANTT